jgi:glucokinase
MILACDSGGTKSNLAFVEATSAGLRIIRLETYRSREHASLDEIVATFVGRRSGD